jgi:Tfp pilus assembly protein PilO
MALGWKGSYFRYRKFFLNIAAFYKEKPDLGKFLELVMSIVAVIIFLLFAIKPTILTIVGLLQQIEEKRQTLTLLTQKVDALQDANTLLAQNQSVIESIDSSIPSLPNPDVLSKQVQGLAAKNSTTISGIAVSQVNLVGGGSPTKTSGDLKPMPENTGEMPFSISIKGDYTNLSNFIKDFENLRVAAKIDSLGITSSITDTGRVIVAVISGRVPFLGNK